MDENNGGSNVTFLLRKWKAGDRSAWEALAPLVHGELRKLAAGYMRNERDGHTLQPTALLNEAYMRLVAVREQNWSNRSHFYGVAAHLMRLILVDHARGRGRAKRGGDGVAQTVALDGAAMQTIAAPTLSSSDSPHA